jgi:chromosome segregation ATPase
MTISVIHPHLPEIANMAEQFTTLANQWASFNVKCTAVRLHLNTLSRAIQNAELRIARAEIALEAANGHGQPTAADIQNAREVLEDARAILIRARNKLTRAEDGTNDEFRAKNRPDTQLWGSIVE